MRRDEGWQFMRLGRYLERAERSTRLVQARHADERLRGRARPAQCLARAPRRRAAHEAYLQVDAAALSPESIARFLMLDPRFPRSVAFCLGEVEAAIQDLDRHGRDGRRTRRRSCWPAPRATWSTAPRAGRGAAPRSATSSSGCSPAARSIDAALGDSCFIAAYERTPIGQHAQASRQAQN